MHDTLKFCICLQTPRVDFIRMSKQENGLSYNYTQVFDIIHKLYEKEAPTE